MDIKNNKILQALHKKTNDIPPVWIMRQAGRYLDSYMAVRHKCNSFWDLCLNETHATEVAVAAVRDLDVDASIVFSDILIVPYAMGMDVKFINGPVLQPIISKDELQFLDFISCYEKMAPTYKSIAMLCSRLDVPVIGFAGAPYTVAMYMMGATKNTRPIENPQLLDDIAILLISVTAKHIQHQVAHGASIIQIFDSFGGPSKYNFLLRNQIREMNIGVPLIIYSPRADLYIEYSHYFDCVSVHECDDDICSNVQEQCTLQGKFPVEKLFDSKDNIKIAVEDMVRKFNKKPYIFNLASGIDKSTPVDNVIHMIKCIREFSG